MEPGNEGTFRFLDFQGQSRGGAEQSCGLDAAMSPGSVIQQQRAFSNGKEV